MCANQKMTNVEALGMLEAYVVLSEDIVDVEIDISPYLANLSQDQICDLQHGRYGWLVEAIVLDDVLDEADEEGEGYFDFENDNLEKILQFSN